MKTLSYKQHIRQTLELAVPVVLGQLGHVFMGVVDSAMVGKLGHIPLAATALANSVFFLLFVLGIGISYAIAPMVSAAVGVGKEEECSLLFRQSFIVNMATGAVLFGVVYVAADYLYLFNEAGEVTRQAAVFMRIIGLSIIPVLLFQTYRQFIEGLSVMRPAMIIAIVANVFNAFFNWVFIFGNLGFPRLDIAGSGLATLLSRVLMAVAIIWFVHSSSRFKVYKLNPFPLLPNRTVITRLLKVGLPSGFQYFFEVGAFSFAAIMIGWLGARELAAHQIAIGIAAMFYMVPVGISAAAAIRVGGYAGKHQAEELRRASFAAISLGGGLMAVLGLLLIAFRYLLPALFVDDERVIEIASTLLLITAFFQIFDGTQAVALGVLRGMLDVKFPTIYTFVGYWVVCLPLAWVLGFIMEMGVTGIWIGLLVGLAFAAAMGVYRINQKTRHG